MDHDYAFEMAASAVRFGVGVTREVGADLREWKASRVLVLTDPTLSRLSPVHTVLESLDAHGIQYTLFDSVRVEPTDESVLEAIAFANQHPFDALVAVGGGSTIDTAKAVNLYTTYPPADFLDYVNPPIGKGLPVPGPVKPLMAIPTTAGTGSETTGVAIFDLKRMHAKTGIANRRLKPTLGLLDPDNTRTMPPQVAASTGLDILSHAVESFTAMPYTGRPRPDSPAMRPAYQGSNPISDVWSMQALRMVARFLVRAVDDPSDEEARASMLLASAYAGIGFGNAGVHLPHGMSYPVSGNVKSYRAPGYERRSPARAAWRVRDPECAGGLPLHSIGQSAATSVGGRGAWRRCLAGASRGCGRHPRRSDYVVHAAPAGAEWSGGAGLLVFGHPGTGRGHAATAPRNEVVAAAGATGGPGGTVRVFHDRVVTRPRGAGPASAPENRRPVSGIRYPTPEPRTQNPRI